MAHQLTDDCCFVAFSGKWVFKNERFYLNTDFIEKRWHSGYRAWILVEWSTWEIERVQSNLVTKVLSEKPKTSFKDDGVDRYICGSALDHCLADIPLLTKKNNLHFKLYMGVAELCLGIVKKCRNIHMRPQYAISEGMNFMNDKRQSGELYKILGDETMKKAWGPLHYHDSVVNSLELSLTYLMVCNLDVSYYNLFPRSQNSRKKQ